MKRNIVNATWNLEFDHNGTKHSIDATVPGNVHLDLMDHGFLSDPYYGDNVHALVQWEQTEWRYRARLSVPVCGEGETVYLRFEGIDTIATIRINDEPVATSRNMFVPVRIDVTLWAGTDVDLDVEIASAVASVWEKKRPASAVALDYNFESLFLRKARHSFGWDIAPRIVTAGLWKPVFFETQTSCEIDDVYVYTIDATKKNATVGIEWNLTVPTETANAKLQLSIEDEAGTNVAETTVAVRFPTGHISLNIEKPALWWPRSFGKPSLHTLKTRLLVDEKKVDTSDLTFGVRTVELVRADAVNGRKKEFKLMVNGEAIFARGSNWVPSDAFHSRAASKAVTNLQPYIDSDCNILRIWGGGIYEDDSLFDACDREGIMIWQDFMLGCELPPNDTTYHEEIRAEVEVIARRYRNHPSLVIWCGDNENDAAYRQWHGIRHDINIISRKVIPDVLSSHDPYRPFLPSSPFISETAWHESKEDPDRSILEIIPEHHLWGPRDAFKGDFYRLNTAVFVSEIGYHGCPGVESLTKFIEPAAMDRSTPEGTRQWITHATQPYGDIDGRYAHRINLMEKQVTMLFGDLPKDLARFTIASQISQAEAMKYFVEHFRIRKWKKSGIIWWNMQDMWPQFSDAVIDYYGVKKLAWYYIARSQKPVCIAVDEADSWKRDMFGLNDTAELVEGTYKVTTEDGTVAVEDAFTIPANSSRKIGELPYSDSRHRLYTIEWTDNHGKSGTNHYVCGDPPLDLDIYIDQWIPRIRADESHFWPE